MGQREVATQMWDRGKANESARHEIGAVDQPATDQKIGV